MAEAKKYLDQVGLSLYDEKIKAKIDNGDAKVLSDAKAYADGLADNYDAAGTAATKVKELEDGQVAINKEAIEKLNGDASTDGSVAKAVADAQSALQSEIDALTDNVGDLETLNTTDKDNLVDAINEVRNSVSAGGTAATVTMTTNTTTEGALKSYTIMQGENVVGTIDIPKDMVVESGEVVVDPEGQDAGTYIKLVLANVTEPLYINVGTLVDIYKAKADAAQVQIVVDSSTREISASIVASSITDVELADNAVTTVKIADGNVTKTKLSTAVQASLDKADSAAPQTALDAEVTRASEAEAKALSDAKVYTDEQVAAEKTRAEGVESGLDERLQAVEDQLGDGEGSVDDKIATAKQEAIDAAATDATTKANAVQTELDDYKTANDAAVKANADAIAAFEPIATSDIEALFA